MNTLVSRDGKIIRDIGSWEKEQLQKYKEVKKEKEPRQGRRPFDLDKYPNLYISERDSVRSGKYWFVCVTINGLRQPAKKFYFKDYPDKDVAFLEAKSFRDAEIEKAKKELGL